MSGVATAIVGGAVATAVIGSNAAQSASHAQAEATNNATTAQENMFGVQQANNKPYMDAGYKALDEIQGNMSTYNQPFTMKQFQEDPGYQFDLQQGEQALQNSSAASGHMISSQQLGNASNYAQSMASNEFNNAFNRYQTNNQNSFNRLASVAQLGQTGTASTNGAAQNAANNISSNMIGAGNASAAGTIGTANAISSGIGTATNGLMMNNMMSNLMPQNNGGFNAGVYNTTQQAQNLNGSSSLSMPSYGGSSGGTMSSLLTGG